VNDDGILVLIESIEVVHDEGVYVGMVVENCLEALDAPQSVIGVEPKNMGVVLGNLGKIEIACRREVMDPLKSGDMNLLELFANRFYCFVGLGDGDENAIDIRPREIDATVKALRLFVVPLND
jgi:hypothetical protein